MNKVYKVIWNKATQTFQAISEIGKSHTTSSSLSKATFYPVSFSFRSLKVRLLTLFISGFMGQMAVAAPTGGQVVAGQAAINQAGNITNINQLSQNATINWQQFGIKSNETVNFNQPNANAITLNRVLGNEKSVIDGAMNANGKVFIQNANGTLINKNAQINVGGLVATTASISDDDLMKGNLNFTGGSKGSIENYGSIKVPAGGMVAMIAPVVKDNGTITAHDATTLLASAEAFSITLPDSPSGFSYTLKKGTLQGLVSQGGAILADGGHVVLTALGVDAVKKSVINQTGLIQANTISNKNGKIELLGDLNNTQLNFQGMLKAEAPNGGNGGFIETSAAKVKIADSANVSTQAKNGKTGEWLIDPIDFVITPTGDDDTSGSTISGKTLTNALKKTDMTVTAMGGTSRTEKGDVIVNDTIDWGANNLTLNAHNDIQINKTLNGTGSAKLTLQYGQGTADGGTSNYYVLNKAKVNLPAGDNLTIQKGSSGEAVNYTVIKDLPKGGILGKYNIAIGSDIDLSGFNGGSEFNGWVMPDNKGNIHGLGHTINNLTINTTKPKAGLIQELQSGEIRDLGLNNANITGESYTGGLIGLGSGNILLNSNTVKGTITGKNAYTGGLIGKGDDTTLVNNLFSGKVTGTSYVGGLAGDAKEIKDSAVMGGVHGSNDNIGGLVGAISGNITNSTANTIQVTGDNNVGGLAGQSGEGVYKSYAVGKVIGTNNVGGLKGNGDGGYSVISESYFLGDVTGKDYVGGLSGNDIDKIDNSYVSGTVTGKDKVGGLVGDGYSEMDVQNAYFNGKVTGDTNVSNLFGVETYDYTYNHNYFNSDKTGKIGKYGEPKTLTEMMKKATYEGWDFDTLWRISEGSDTPRLRNVLNVEEVGLAKSTSALDRIKSEIPKVGCSEADKTCGKNTPRNPMSSKLPINETIVNEGRITDAERKKLLNGLSPSDKEFLKKLEDAILENNWLDISSALLDLTKETTVMLDVLLKPESFSKLQWINETLAKNDLLKMVEKNGHFIIDAKSQRYVESLIKRADSVGENWNQLSKTGKVVKSIDYIMKAKDIYETAKIVVDMNEASKDGTLRGNTIDLVTKGVDLAGWGVPVVATGMTVWKTAIALDEIIAGEGVSDGIKRDTEGAKSTLEYFKFQNDQIIRQLSEGKITKKQAQAMFNNNTQVALDGLGNINDNLIITDSTPLLDNIGKRIVITIGGVTGNSRNIEQLQNTLGDGIKAVAEYKFTDIVNMAQTYRIARGDLSSIN